MGGRVTGWLFLVVELHHHRFAEAFQIEEFTLEVFLVSVRIPFKPIDQSLNLVEAVGLINDNDTLG